MQNTFLSIVFVPVVYGLCVWGGSWLFSLVFTQFHILTFLQSLVIGALVALTQYFFTYKQGYDEHLKLIATRKFSDGVSKAGIGVVYSSAS
jgi:hypothetical protein